MRPFLPPAAPFEEVRLRRVEGGLSGASGPHTDQEGNLRGRELRAAPNPPVARKPRAGPVVNEIRRPTMADRTGLRALEGSELAETLRGKFGKTVASLVCVEALIELAQDNELFVYVDSDGNIFISPVILAASGAAEA